MSYLKMFKKKTSKIVKHALGCSALIAAFGCQKNAENTIAYQTPVHQPVVTVVPVVDTVKNEDYPWNLSEEFTSSIYSFLEQGSLHIEALSQAREKIKRLKENHNPFSTQISWLKQVFDKQEFVVFLELMQHEEILKKENNSDPKTCAADLNMSMRVRVFDLRGEEPQVVLQEILNDAHFIPRQFTRTNFHQIPWGQDNFNFSPLGLAHLDFAREISSRIEDYIVLALKNHPRY